MTIHMHKEQLRILHLEDNRDDAELVNIRLRSAGYDCQIALVESRAAFREALDHGPYDLILSDYTLPSFDGLSALRLVREKYPDLPFIFVSGTLGEDSAIESLVNGATDYVQKGTMSRLLPAVNRAVREAKERRDRLLAEGQARKAEGLYRLITENAGDLITVLDLDGKRVYNSPSYQSLLGDVGASRGTDSFNEVHPDDRERIQEIFRQTVRTGVGQRSEYRFVLKDGRIRHIESQGNVVRGDTGKPVNVVVVSRDVTDRKEANEALRRSEGKFRELVEQAADGIVIADEEWNIVEVNSRACEMLGFAREEFVGLNIRETYEEHEIDRGARRMIALKKGETVEFERRMKHKSGALIPVEVRLKKLHDGTFQAIVRDTTERLRSEERIRFQASVLDQVRNAVFSTNLDGRVTFWNGYAEQLFGWSAEEVLGRDPSEFLFDSGDQSSIRTRREIIDRMGYWEGEMMYRRRDRSTVPVYGHSTRLVDREGNPSGCVDVAVDITDWKRVEAETVRARDFYLSLFEDFPALVWRADTDGKYNYFNRTWLAFTGRTLERELGDGWIDGIHPEDVDRCLQTYHDALAKRRPFETECRLMHYTGEYHWIVNIGRPFNDLGGNFGGFIGTCVDITDRKLAEDQLSFLSQAVKQSPAPIVLTDRDGAIEYVNPRFTALTGYSLKEVLGQNPRILKSGETPPEEYRRLWQTILGGGEWHGEFHNKRKDGTLYWEYASISPVVTNGVITHFLALKEDMTERKSMEEQVRQMQKMESIGTLAGGIAHDFNNILAIIMGHLSLIEIKKREPEAVGIGIDAINKAVQRGAGLVRQILTFARKSDIVLEPVSVNLTISELAAMLQATFPKTIEVKLSLEKAIPVIVMDHTQLHQTLLNLCVNARDAMMEPAGGGRSPGGTLRIGTSVVEGSGLRGRHAEAHAATYLCVSVSDTGVGMDAETKRRIFEPFFTTKEAGKGTGLGLAVVYGVVRGHHGLIEVDSTPAKGTTVRLYLPVPEGIVAPAVENKNADVEIRGGSETILLVEDEVAIAGLMETLLADRGYQVLRAADGEEALAVYAAHKDEIALVLSDLGLPKLDGVALFARLVEINAHVKVIIASGYVEPDIRAELTRAGAKGIISKPYVPGEVLRIVRNVLDSASGPQQG